MQNTPKNKIKNEFLFQQNQLIQEFSKQPLIIVLRASNKVFESKEHEKIFLNRIENLHLLGIKNIEIAWTDHHKWKDLIIKIRSKFPSINLGAASIINEFGLNEIIELNFSYAMSPFWDPNLQKKAKDKNQVLIPGVFSPTEIQQAISYESQIIKLFPASILGKDYLERIQSSINSLPFIIAAGGIDPEEIDIWLKKGFSAVALGKKLIKGEKISKTLLTWLKIHKKKYV